MIWEKNRKLPVKKVVWIRKRLLKNKIVSMILRKMFWEKEKIVNLFVVQKADSN